MSDQTTNQLLEYLPAIFQEHPFLGQFLLPFEQVLAGFDNLLSTIDETFALSDPEGQTKADFLPWLATWVALVLDEAWDGAKRRQLISEATSLYRERGTLKGLKRYLEIYTGLAPEIRECRWPGGMRIGVASRIGGPLPPQEPPAPNDDSSPPFPPECYPVRIDEVKRSVPEKVCDYYVVSVSVLNEDDKVKAKETHIYRTDLVKSVSVAGDFVTIVLLSNPTGETHQPARVTRRDGLIDDRYDLTYSYGDDFGQATKVTYGGDTRLIDEVELPYRFILDVRVPRSEIDNVKLDKVRAIVDLEKPAHTVYYLKLTPV
jgi:phage tail-like protein